MTGRNTNSIDLDETARSGTSRAGRKLHFFLFQYAFTDTQMRKNGHAKTHRANNRNDLLVNLHRRIHRTGVVMCISPLKIASGQLIACRKCWQCRERKINDWVGRCVAESKTSSHSYAVTLTYGRDRDGNENHERTEVLTYSDVQKYLKRLRRSGYKVRYLAIGEYGTMKARAHWHLILFFEGGAPAVPKSVRFNEPHWPHGYSFWEPSDAATVRYVCKYVQKETSDEAQGHMAMSKNPPLGAKYFERLAGLQVKNGIAPQDLVYSFPEVKKKDGSKIQFMLSGRSSELYIESFLRQWREKHDRRPPYSEMIEQHLDKTTPEKPELSVESEAIQRGYEPRKEDEMPRATRPVYNRAAKSYICFLGETRYVWTLNMEKGKHEWQRVKVRPAPSPVDGQARYREQTKGQ